MMTYSEMYSVFLCLFLLLFFFFQAEDGIRDLVRSRGLGDVYKRQRHIELGGPTLRIAENPLHRMSYRPTKV